MPTSAWPVDGVSDDSLRVAALECTSKRLALQKWPQKQTTAPAKGDGSEGFIQIGLPKGIEVRDLADFSIFCPKIPIFAF